MGCANGSAATAKTREAVRSQLITWQSNLQDCQAAYLGALPAVRRQLNQACFDKIYADEGGAVRFDLADPFALLLDPQVRSSAVLDGTKIQDQAEEAPRLPEQASTRVVTDLAGV